MVVVVVVLQEEGGEGEVEEEKEEKEEEDEEDEDEEVVDLAVPLSLCRLRTRRRVADSSVIFLARQGSSFVLGLGETVSWQTVASSSSSVARRLGALFAAVGTAFRFGRLLLLQGPATAG